jgi:hypothetical protein
VIDRRASPAPRHAAVALSLLTAGLVWIVPPLAAQTGPTSPSGARKESARPTSSAGAASNARSGAAGEHRAVNSRPGVPTPTSAAQRAALPAADDVQKAAAELVYYGRYVCDQKWEIHVERHALSPGYVDVRYQKEVWVMKPVASATGAVRLEDMKQQTLLVQIPSKSMLLNTRTGQRVVDSCVGEGHLNAMKAPAPSESDPPAATALVLGAPSD